MSLLTLDHIALAAETLEAGTAHAERLLGAQIPTQGAHPDMGTHNRLLGMGPLYFEVIAIDPDATPPDRPRWFNLDAFSGPPRLTNWILRTQDMEAALDRLGPGYGVPLTLKRGPYRWRMAVPETGLLPFDGWAPAVIEWQGEAHPTQALGESGVQLSALRLKHPAASEMAAALAPLMQPDTILFQPADRPELIAEITGLGDTRISLR